VRSDAVASKDRVGTLGNDLAMATSARDRSRREAALARTALETARAAHLQSADELAAERSDLDRARTQAYASLVDASQRSVQLTALHTCLDGVSQALDMLGSGDVNDWQHRLQQVDGICRRAEAVAT
jgi:hypothetical protein